MRNLIGFATKSGSMGVLLNKLRTRFFDERGMLSQKQNAEWLRQNGIDFAKYAIEDDAPLWEESIGFAKEFQERVEAKLRKIDVPLGGGGHYTMLYFLTLQKQPKVIVETGVAAGYSSQTFLSAIEKNGKGKLYSSDFPYFRLENPEQYIGILVDEKYRKGWALFIEGDEVNLPKIAVQVKNVGLFHYDSDKRYRGRMRAFQTMRDKFSSGTNVIFDDIQDNSFFHDLVTKENIAPSNWKVISYQGKFIGWIVFP